MRYITLGILFILVISAITLEMQPKNIQETKNTGSLMISISNKNVLNTLTKQETELKHGGLKNKKLFLGKEGALFPNDLDELPFPLNKGYSDKKIGVKANTSNTFGTIYIKADGSVDPSDAPIQRDGNTYILTDDIITNVGNFYGIVIEKDDIIFDGANHTLEYNGLSYGIGIYLNERSNITISNVNVKNFYTGIFLNNSNSNLILENSFVNNALSGISIIRSSNITIRSNRINGGLDGIYLNNSTNNSLIGNHLENNPFGISLTSSDNNIISENTFINGGLILWYSYNNSVIDNLVNGKPLVYLENIKNYTVSDAGQIVLVSCEEIKISNLNISNTTVGVELLRTNNTEIIENNLANNTIGILIWESSNNYIIRNTLRNGGEGVWFSYAHNNSIIGNNIEGNGVGVYIEYSHNDSVVGNNIMNNTGGINMYRSEYFKIVRNNVTGSHSGIYLDFASNNTFIGNNISSNRYGVELHFSCDNKFWNNDFINNTKHVIFDVTGCFNIWDGGYPTGGNYWSNYDGVDEKSGPDQDQSGSDGIGDTWYIMDGSNIDHYPLMKPVVPKLELPKVSTLPATKIASNSAVLNMHVDVGDFPYVEIRFVWRAKGGSWTYTPWMKVYSSGNYSLTLTRLDSSAEYEFYAQLKFGSMVLNGDTLRFKTSFALPLANIATFASMVFIVTLLVILALKKLRSAKKGF